MYVNIRGITDLRELYQADFTNPGSMEEGEHGLTRETCFVVRRLDVVSVAGLLWISWCFFGAAGFRAFLTFFFVRTRPAASMRPPCLIYLSTSILGQPFSERLLRLIPPSYKQNLLSIQRRDAKTFGFPARVRPRLAPHKLAARVSSACLRTSSA